MILWLFLAFVVVPLAELGVIIEVAGRLGVLATLTILLGFSVAGAILAKREGMAVWRRFRAALSEGRIPSGEVMDGFLVLLGGALLLTPGFITDAAGLLLVLPFTRPVVKRLAGGAARSYVRRRGFGRDGRA